MARKARNWATVSGLHQSSLKWQLGGTSSRISSPVMRAVQLLETSPSARQSRAGRGCAVALRLS